MLEDTARFEAIPGIGKKTAQRVVLELKEKIGLRRRRARRTGPDGHLVARDALVELGYTLLDAERALAEVDPGAAGRGTRPARAQEGGMSRRLDGGSR